MRTRIHVNPAGSSRVIWVAGILCAVIAFAAWYQTPVTTNAPAVLAAGPSWAASPFSSPAYSAVGAQTPLRAGPGVAPGLGDAPTLLTTYLRLARCVEARATERSGRAMAFTAAELCRHLSEESLAQRSLLLERAAQAAEPGAWWAYSTVPVADGARSSHLEMLKGFQLAAASQGDREALLALATQAERDGGDPRKALAYWIAYEQIGLASSESPTESMSHIEAHFRRGLPPAEVANAVSDGTQFAQRALQTGCALCNTDTTDGATLPGDLVGSILAFGIGTASKNDRSDRTAGVPFDKIEVCNSQRCETASLAPGGLWIRQRH